MKRTLPGAVTLVLMLIGAWWGPDLLGQEPGGPPPIRDQGELASDSVMERDLAPGITHAWEIELAEGDAVALQVHQTGVDIVVRVLTPEGALEAEVDGPGVGESERLEWIAGLPGRWSVRVFPFRSEESGEYGIEVVEVRSATADEVRRYAGEEYRRLWMTGVARRARGLAGEAEEFLTKAVAALHSRGQEADPVPLADRALVLEELSEVHQETGRADEALARGREAAAIYEDLLAEREGSVGADDPSLSPLLRQMATLELRVGDPEGAEALLRRAVGTVGGRDDQWEEHVGSLALLAVALERQNEFQEASEAFAGALGILDGVVEIEQQGTLRETLLAEQRRNSALAAAAATPPAEGDTARIMGEVPGDSVASAVVSPGRVDLWAVPTQAGESVEVEVDESHADVVLHLLHPDGSVHATVDGAYERTSESVDWVALANGRWTVRVSLYDTTASGYYRIRIARREPAQPTELSASRALAANQEGIARFREDDHAAALELFRRARELWLEAGQGSAADAAVEIGNVGSALRELGRFEEARDAFQVALDEQETLRGPDDPAVASVLESLGNLLHDDMDDAVVAVPLLRRRLAILEARADGPDLELADAMYDLARALWSADGAEEAAELLLRELTVLEEVPNPHEFERGLAHLTLGGVLRNLERYREALSHMEAAIPLLEDVSGADSESVATHLDEMATVLRELGEPVRAMEYRERAADILVERLETDRETAMEVTGRLIDDYVRTAAFIRARDTLERHLERWEAASGPGASEVVELRQELAHVQAATGDLRAAEGSYRRVIELRESRGAAEEESAFAHLGLATVYLMGGRMEESARASALALGLLEARFGEDGQELVEALFTRGVTALMLGRVDEGARLFERAATILEIAGAERTHNYASVLLGRSIVAVLSGRMGERTDLLEEAIALVEALEGPDSPSLAGFLVPLATQELYVGLYRSSEAHLQRALDIVLPRARSQPLQAAQALARMGSLYMLQGRMEEAEAALRRGIELAGEVDSRNLLVPVIMPELVALLESQGRLAEAEAAAHQALTVARENLGAESREVGRILARLGSITNAQGDSERAEAFYREAFEVLDRENVTPADRLTTLMGLSDLLVGRGETDEAITLAERALDEVRPYVGSSSLMLLGPLRHLAMARMVSGDIRGALPLLEEALELSEAESLGSVMGVGVRIDMAAAYLTLGELDRAEALADQAVEVTRTMALAAETGVGARGIRAAIYKAQGRWEGAMEDLTAAVDLLEVQRPAVGGDEETRALFLSEHTDVFDQLVDLLVSAGRAEEAFRTSERGRARVLLDQLASARIDIRSSIPPDVLEPLEERERDALARIAEFQQRLTLLRSATGLAEELRTRQMAILEDSLQAADEAYQGAYRSIKAASPLWRDLLTANGNLVGVDQLRTDVVRSDGLLLSYDFGPENGFVFVLPGDGGEVQALPLHLPEGLASAAGLEPGPLDSEAIAWVFAEGQQGHPDLFRALVPDGLWQQIEAAAQVIVIPDGPLHRFPFDALVVDPDGLEGPTYWLDAGPPLRYGASATALYAVERRPRTRTTGFGAAGVLSLSDVVYDPAELEEGALTVAERVAEDRGALTRDAYERLGGTLARLPGTALETDSIAAAFASGLAAADITVLSGSEASEPLLRAALAGQRYLHLATHGLVNDTRSSLFASLALTPPPGETSDAGHDGFLQLHEIYDLPLDEIELAVLSACETNVGARVEGEGIFALSRGFLVAGARRVVASQWAVNDESTAALMAAFFRQIAEAEARAQPVDYAAALRAAQRAVRHHAEHPEWADPYYWAPFVLSGSR